MVYKIKYEIINETNGVKSEHKGTLKVDDAMSEGHAYKIADHRLEKEYPDAIDISYGV